MKNRVAMVLVTTTWLASSAAAQTDATQDPEEAFRVWLNADGGASSASVGATSLEEGARIARLRRPAMLARMRIDPSSALDHAVTFDEWVDLPEGIRALVEEPFSERGDLQSYSDCRPAGDRAGHWQVHEVRLGGRWMPAHLGDEIDDWGSQTDIPVQGIRLGGECAIWDDPMLPLFPEEFGTVRSRYPAGASVGRSWLTGKALSGDPVFGLMGGKVYAFASLDEIARINETLREAARHTSPHALSASLAAGSDDVFDAGAAMEAAWGAAGEWTETPKRVLCMRLDYTPSVGTPYSPTLFFDFMQRASEAIHDMSFEKTRTVATVTPEVLTLPHDREHYNTVAGYRGDIADDAKAAAAAAGYDLDAYDIYVYAFPRLFRTRTPAWAGGSNQWINGFRVPSVMIHEFGHNYGLGHANSWRGYTGTGFEGHFNPDFSFVEHTEYGDVFDMMGNDRHWTLGNEPVYPAGHFSMSGKARLNWIEADEVKEVTESGVYRVVRFDHVNARCLPGNVHGLKVVTSDGETLWVGHRRNFPSNQRLSHGAYIVWANTSRSHRLIDATPLSKPSLREPSDFNDGALAVGETYVDPSGSVAITTLRSGGTAPREYIDLLVTLIESPAPQPTFALFADESGSTPGLTGSYFNHGLYRYTPHFDWRRWIPVAGTRVDAYPGFTEDDWGDRYALGLKWGNEENWELFSVQWDGFIRVTHGPMRFSLHSDDGSRMWIDVNGDGRFSPWPDEFLNHNFGGWQIAVLSRLTPPVPPGTYAVRIQYYDIIGWNDFVLFGVGP